MAATAATIFIGALQVFPTSAPSPPQAFPSRPSCRPSGRRKAPSAPSSQSNCTTVSDYLTTWLAEWVETYGVDGFRCDTAKHVELASWKKLKTKCVTALQNWRRNNPTAVGADWDEDFWMTGECWDYGSGKSEYHTVGGFDSMINFSFSGRSLDGPSSINNVYQDYADRINSDPNFNVLTYNSSHDSNLARGDLYWQGTSLMLLPGGVQPFYGDETNRPTDIRCAAT